MRKLLLCRILASFVLSATTAETPKDAAGRELSFDHQKV